MKNIHDDLENTVLKLSDYLSTVSMVVKETFAHHVWIKAEIRNLSSKGGHYYFELAEKDSSGKIIASCRANLWKYQAQWILAKFVKSTGMELQRDLTVMLKITANLHPQYGFSLNITDIDPNYTVGDLAQQYNEMLDRLTGEGLTQLNKTHELALDLQHIIVIAPEKAAGLGDFQAEANCLQVHHACQFHYHHATFQGNHAPEEIRRTITQSVEVFQKQQQRLPDLMVIIRGGGAVGDLAYLNDYELAALIAEQSMPVWVGVGHERDKVILDEVAHTSFDTPSKVILAIIEQLRKLLTNAKQYITTIRQNASHQLTHARYNCQQTLQIVKSQGHAQIKQYQVDINHHYQQLKQLSYHQLHQAISDSEHLRSVILLQHPRKVVQQGYAIVRNKDSEVMSSNDSITIGQTLTIELKDGLLESQVIKKL